jgi:hypothetical protein
MKSFLVLGFRKSAVWTVTGALFLATLSSTRGQELPVSVVEAGVGPNQIVEIASSNLGYNLWVYACVIELELNNVPTVGFCIDPWHWSGVGNMYYTAEALSQGPKYPGNMDSATALKIEQLWNQFYTPDISNSMAAGLQIAIWDLVSASVSASTNGASWFFLQSGDDFGASTMLTWVNGNPNATAAQLSAVTGPGQDYVVMSSVLPQPPAAFISAPPTAYTGSPLTVSSTASAPNGNLAMHSVEWMSPAGAWTVDSAAATGTDDARTVGITFSTPGTWTLRAGASVDNGATWVYSSNRQVTVSSGVVSYTLATMAVPPSNLASWYAPSPVVTKTYQVQHVNP